LDNRYRKL